MLSMVVNETQGSFKRSKKKSSAKPEAKFGVQKESCATNVHHVVVLETE
jgi:hypothetical protein